MESKQRTHISWGIFLILLGLVFLAFQIFPNLDHWLALTLTWPMIIIFVALGLLVIGLLTSNPEMAIPACIVGGIGSILYVQNAGLVPWESWSYLWTLIPGFVGVGLLISGLLSLKKKPIFEGLETMLVSAAMFAIFGSLFGNILGHSAFQGTVLPIFIIILGIVLLIRALIPERR